MVVGPTIDTAKEEPPSEAGSLRRAAVIALALVTALVLVLWLLGGFDRRQDYARAEPGEEVDAGNLVFAFTSATAQQARDGSWEVVVAGTVRNPNDHPLAPVGGNSGNLAVLPGDGQPSVVLETTDLGGTWRRSLVPPGDRPIELGARFDAPDGTQFGETIDCAVITFEFSDNSVLGIANGEKTWHPDSGVPATLVTLPLRTLPPQK